GDSANDGARVAADELRVHVVVEGGNLGFTQAARVEYALAGGRINCDAIDNAAGVNMSDHEVNLKILFAPLVESGELAQGERNRLLSQLTDEVIEKVLETNRSQARALSLDRIRSETRLKQFAELLRALEEAGVLDRVMQRLPDKETLRRRRGNFLGLTRPELAEVLLHAKLHLQHRLLASPLPDDPHVERHLHAYFPRTVGERFRPAVRNHRLRREIIAVNLVNSLVDVAGVTFVHNIVRDLGCNEVVGIRAWVIAAALADVDKLLAQLATENLSPQAEAQVILSLETATAQACKWVITEIDPANPIHDVVNRYFSSVFELYARIPGIFHDGRRRVHNEAIAALTAQGVSETLAARIVGATQLTELLEIIRLATAVGAPLPLTAETFYRASEIIDVDWIRNGLVACSGEDRWEQQAAEGLMETLVSAHRTVTKEILGHHDPESTDGEVERCVSAYAEKRGAQLGKVRALLKDVRSAARPTLAALVVIMREIEHLCGPAE
ncbi:MAG TPA: NAD-glutamate dehydrogenase domain-containing protein, partial [Vicinamibacterales bacterium]|nr:NAD-glutamate dehydrogenase domain-containing protein [Vicinamibacterales bacterium]